jgi:hypothetical protein
MESEENFAAAFATDHCIHFYDMRIRMMFHKIQKVFVGAAFKTTRILDFCLMYISDFIGHLFGQIDVFYRQGTEVDIVVECFLTEPEFGMVSEDSIRRLSLEDQGCYEFIQDFKVIFRDVDTGSGLCKDGPIPAVSSCRLIVILIHTAARLFRTAVANKGSLVQKGTVIGALSEVRTNAVAKITGTTGF